MYLGRQTCVRQGFSCAGDESAAARELYERLYDPSVSLAVFFASADYDVQVLERELGGWFGHTPLIGCTSAGGIAALILPPVACALIGLFLLARESRAGASSRPPVPAPPPR